jgi:hypothetical protein
MDHQIGKSDKVVQSGYGLRQPFVILDQPPKPARPRKIALHYPPPEQKHEPSLDLRVLDHLQTDAVLRGLCCRPLSAVSLIHISQLNVLTGRLLDRPSQRLNLCSILFVGRRYVQG